MLIAVLLPLACSWLAKWGIAGLPVKDGGFDNRDPRAWLARQGDWRARANAAQITVLRRCLFHWRGHHCPSTCSARARLDILAFLFIVLGDLHRDVRGRTAHRQVSGCGYWPFLSTWPSCLSAGASYPGVPARNPLSAYVQTRGMFPMQVRRATFNLGPRVVSGVQVENVRSVAECSGRSPYGPLPSSRCLRGVQTCGQQPAGDCGRRQVILLFLALTIAEQLGYFGPRGWKWRFLTIRAARAHSRLRWAAPRISSVAPEHTIRQQSGTSPTNLWYCMAGHRKWPLASQRVPCPAIGRWPT